MHGGTDVRTFSPYVVGWLAGQYEISLATSLNAEDRLRLEMAADMCEFRHWKVSIYTNFFFGSNKVFYVFYMEISPSDSGEVVY